MPRANMSPTKVKKSKIKIKGRARSLKIKKTPSLTNSTTPRNQNSMNSSSSTSSVLTTLGLSECSAKLAVAIANPWSPMAKGACLPTGPARPSQKVTAFKRLPMFVGTNGVGFGIFNAAIVNDFAAGWCTNALWSGNVDSPFTPVDSLGSPYTGITPVVMDNLPYSSADIIDSTSSGSPNAAGRMVCLGIQVSYVGTELNRSGQVYCYASPNHSDLSTLTPSQILNFQDADVRPNDRHKCTLSGGPVSPNEFVFGNTLNPEAIQAGDPSAYNNQMYYPWTTAPMNVEGSVQGACPFVVVITGEPGNQCFLEVIAHVEYVGPSTQAVATPSVSDEPGLSKVLAATNRAYEIKQSSRLTFGQALLEGLRQVSRELRPIAGTAAVGVIRAITGI